MTGELRAAVAAIRAELGSVSARIAPDWSAFASACGVDERTAGPATIVVGAAADVLKYAASTSAEFGFVTEVAQRTRRWPRSKVWHYDTTLALWSQGWTPVVVHRVIGTAGRTESTFAVGIARPTPTRPDTRSPGP